MNKEDFFKFHKEFCSEMLSISEKKNADYTGDSPSPFANFTVVERMGISSTEQGFLTRMMDKMQRINSFVQKGILEVEDEKVTDSLQDLANYAILFAAYLTDKRSTDNGSNNISETRDPAVAKWKPVSKDNISTVWERS